MAGLNRRTLSKFPRPLRKSPVRGIRGGDQHRIRRERSALIATAADERDALNPQRSATRPVAARQVAPAVTGAALRTPVRPDHVSYPIPSPLPCCFFPFPCFPVSATRAHCGLCRCCVRRRVRRPHRWPTEGRGWGFTWRGSPTGAPRIEIDWEWQHALDGGRRATFSLRVRPGAWPRIAVALAYQHPCDGNEGSSAVVSVDWPPHGRALREPL